MWCIYLIDMDVLPNGILYIMNDTFFVSLELACVLTDIAAIFRHSITSNILLFLLWDEWWVIDHIILKYDNILFMLYRGNVVILTDMNQICKLTVKDFVHWSVKCRQYISG